TNDVCRDDGTCAGDPVTCEACNACDGGACKAVATDPRCTTCCNGKCCAGVETCVGGTCQQVCLPTQAACDPNDNQCCYDSCEDVRGNCGGENVPQCCYGSGFQCSESCDCCDPNSCVGGICCRNLEGLDCDDEQHPCCAGFQCLNGTCQLETCLHTGDICD